MNKIVLILTCSAVTLLPRIIPYFASSSFLKKLPRFIRKCMLLLPVASLGALIFPLALTDFGPLWIAGLAGVSAAFLTSYLKGPMILAIVIALLSTTGMLMAMGA